MRAQAALPDKLADDVEQLAMDHEDAGVTAVAHVQKLLLGVWRQCDGPWYPAWVDEKLFDVFAGNREDLDAPVAPVRDIHQSVVRHLERVHGTRKLRWPRLRIERGRRRCGRPWRRRLGPV